MNSRWIFKGTQDCLHRIHLDDVTPTECVISPQNVKFRTSFDMGTNHRVVIPGFPPVWRDRELPIQILPDEEAIDPRFLLPCPSDPMLRALTFTSPEFSPRDVDLITDRKNLRALLQFVNGITVNHRINAELIGETLIFHVGWSGFPYNLPHVSYGINFEHEFTLPKPQPIIQHKRVISYSLGNLNVLLRYQVDACLLEREPETIDSTEPSYTTPTGLKIHYAGVLVPDDCIAEIKTLRVHPGGAHQSRPKARTLEQLWFSQTPVLLTGYHNGSGSFPAVDKTNVIETGVLQEWEEENATALRKVVKLVEMIKDFMSNSPHKTAGIVLRNGKFPPLVGIHSLEYGYPASFELPGDLKALWNDGD